MKTVIFQFEVILIILSLFLFYYQLFGVKQKSGTLSNFYKYLIS